MKRRHDHQLAPDWPGYALMFCLGSVATLFVMFLVFADRIL